MALQGSGRRARLTSALSRGSSGRRGAGCGSDRPQHHDLRAALRKIINKEINHFVDNWGEEGQFPAQEVFKTLGQAGFLGAEKTKEYGGMGFDFSYSIAVAEELGRICCGGIPMAIGSASWHGHSCSYKRLETSVGGGTDEIMLSIIWKYFQTSDTSPLP